MLKPSRESNSQDLRLLDLVLIRTKHPEGGGWSVVLVESAIKVLPGIELRSEGGLAKEVEG